MHVQVHYQNLENSLWMDEFIEKRVAKLKKYLSQSSSIFVNLKYEKNNYNTSIVIHNLNNDYVFNGQGANLFEAFSLSVDKAARVLTERKRKLKDKINKKFFSLKHTGAP